MKKLLLAFVALFVLCGSSFAVDLNKATLAELEALNGIGPAKAKAIVDYRTKNGPFKSADDLDNVKGVGKGIIGKISGDVTIDGKSLGVPATGKKPAEKKTAKAKPAEEAAPAAAAASDKPAEKKTAKAKKADEAAPAAAAAAAAPADEKTVKAEKKKKE